MYGPNQKLADFSLMSLCPKSFTVSAITNYTNHRPLIKVLLLPVIPIALLLDILQAFVLKIATIMASFFWYIIRILMHLNYFFFRISEHMANASERTVIVVAFRISLVLGLCITVIINRYTPFFASPETPSAVIEFIASVILIPVILEWILSFKGSSLKNEAK